MSSCESPRTQVTGLRMANASSTSAATTSMAWIEDSSTRSSASHHRSSHDAANHQGDKVNTGAGLNGVDDHGWHGNTKETMGARREGNDIEQSDTLSDVLNDDQTIYGDEVIADDQDLIHDLMLDEEEEEEGVAEEEEESDDGNEDETVDSKTDGHLADHPCSTATKPAGAKELAASRALLAAAQLDCSPSKAATASKINSVPRASKEKDLTMVPALSRSLFSCCNPAIYFPRDNEEVEPLPVSLKALLKWRGSTVTPRVVKKYLEKVGFQYTQKSGEWLGYWGKHTNPTSFRAFKAHQKTNHFPGSFCIGRKDSLWVRLRNMQLRFGRADFSFFPTTYVLPGDLSELKAVWDESGKQKWIMKPPASARGIGIRLINKWEQVPRNQRRVIVQRYLDKPYLINNSKFDLRVYVYVTSYDPLRIYVYDDGLARFATVKYKGASKHIANRFMHLTNYSINKKNVQFTANSDETVCQGHKWGLKALWRHLDDIGVDSKAVWADIIDVVVKTIIASEKSINSHIKANCTRRSVVHELFGFDIFLDQNLKPYVLEVNISPSLHSNSQLDRNIKGGMVYDLLNMANFQLPCRNDSTCGATMKAMGFPCSWLKYPAPGNGLQPDERAKHAFYATNHTAKDIRSTVLDGLTPDDLRILMETEDEYKRCGNFLRVFPTRDTHAAYERYFENPRYYNILLSEWLSSPSLGVRFLQTQALHGLHLCTSTPVAKQWCPPPTTVFGKPAGTGRLAVQSLVKPYSRSGKPPLPPAATSQQSRRNVQRTKSDRMLLASSSSVAEPASCPRRPSIGQMTGHGHEQNARRRHSESSVRASRATLAVGGSVPSMMTSSRHSLRQEGDKGPGSSEAKTQQPARQFSSLYIDEFNVGAGNFPVQRTTLPNHAIARASGGDDAATHPPSLATANRTAGGSPPSLSVASSSPESSDSGIALSITNTVEAASPLVDPRSAATAQLPRQQLRPLRPARNAPPEGSREAIKVQTATHCLPTRQSHPPPLCIPKRLAPGDRRNTIQPRTGGDLPMTRGPLHPDGVSYQQEQQQQQQRWPVQVEMFDMSAGHGGLVASSGPGGQFARPSTRLSTPQTLQAVSSLLSMHVVADNRMKRPLDAGREPVPSSRMGRGGLGCVSRNLTSSASRLPAIHARGSRRSFS